MAYLQSYPETIRQQFSPPIEAFLTEQFPSFEEKVKYPDSPERKILDTIIAVVANISFAEKAANDAQAFIHYLNDMSEKDDFIANHRTESFDLYDDDEEKKAEKIDVTGVLLTMSAQLAEIQAKKALLETQFQKNLLSLNEQENKMIQEEFKKHQLNSSEAEKYNQFYTERNRGTSTRLGKAKRNIKVESVLDSILYKIKLAIKSDPTPSKTQKLDDVKMERALHKPRQEAAKRLQEGLKDSDQVSARDSVGSEIILLRMLKEELGDQYSIKVLAGLAGDIHRTTNGFTLLKQELEDNHQEAINKLDGRAKEIQERQQKLASRGPGTGVTVAPQITRNDNVAVDENTATSAPSMTPKPGDN